MSRAKALSGVRRLVDGNNAINVLRRPEMKWYQGLKPLYDHNFLPMKSKQCTLLHWLIFNLCSGHVTVFNWPAHSIHGLLELPGQEIKIAGSAGNLCA